MADAKLPGNDAGEDKSKLLQESQNGGLVPAKNDAKINSAMTNSKRRRQRRKFSAALKKSGLELNGRKIDKNIKPVTGNKVVPGMVEINRKVQDAGKGKSEIGSKSHVEKHQDEAKKAVREDIPRVREDLHPRPSSSDSRRLGVEERTVFSGKPKLSLEDKVPAKQKPEEYILPGEKKVAPEPEEFNVSGSDRNVLEPDGPNLQKPDQMAPEPASPDLLNPNQNVLEPERLKKAEAPFESEPVIEVPLEVPKVEEPENTALIGGEQGIEPEEDVDDRSAGVTHFSHPFSSGDEDAVKPSGEDSVVVEENGVVSAGEQEKELPVQDLQPEEPLIENEAILEEEPVKYESSSEDEISIGKEESSPPIPIGRIEEVEPDQRHDEPENISKNDEVATVSVIDSKKDDEIHDKNEKLVEKKSTGKVLKSWLLMNWPKFTAFIKNLFAGAGRQAGGVFSHLNAGMIISCLFLVLLLGGGYYGYGQKWHEKAYSYLSGFFTPKPVEKVVVKVDLSDQKRFGITTSAIFGRNSGSVDDLIPAQINAAIFFGELREPQVKGETGITALTYYGELKDGAEAVNQFVSYMTNLEDIQNLYKTDVYAMLDRSTARDKSLLDYQGKLKLAREKSAVLHAQVILNMDDFKKSYDSLTPDKTKYEQDFFAAMESLQPEKSDLLMKGFIDITQKQAALKARVSALTKLEAYYTAALQKLDIRILAVEQNRDALIQGIRVVDIPGADLNIIIKSAQK